MHTYVCTYVYSILLTYRNSRFGHGTQEDSHEVLRCLLSALRDEELDVSYTDLNIPTTH